MATSTTQALTPKTRKLSVKLVILVALGLAATGAAAFYLGSSSHNDKPVATVPADPIFIALDPFTVNLQPDGKARYLHIAVTLKVADTKSQNQVTQYLPEVRSRILTVLSNRQADSLTSPDNKTQLAGEIMVALNQPFVANLPSQKVSSVMFTTFMLQ